MKNILVVSHERSGTHFLMNTIGSNFGYDAVNRIDVHCKDYIYPEESYKKNYKKEIEDFFYQNHNSTNRIFKSHHQFNYYEDYFDKILDNFNVFYITRDVKDTLASCYNYFNEAQVTAFPICDTTEEFLFETVPYLYPYDGAYSYERSENMVERWKKHIDTWKPVYDKIHVVKYEDLINDFDTEVNKISDYLGIKLENDAVNPPVGFNSINPGTGGLGKWKEVITDQQAERIEGIIK